MKNSDKFWLLTVSLTCIISFALFDIVRDFFGIILLAVTVTYLLMNIFYIFWRFGRNMDEKTSPEFKVLLFHWILYIPIKKFNDFLNNKQ